MRIIYVSDGNYVQGPDGGWYTTGAFPLRFIASRLPELKEFCFWGRLHKADDVSGLIRVDSMLPADRVRVVFDGPVGQKTGPLHYLRGGGSSIRRLRKLVRRANVLWSLLPSVYGLLSWIFRTKDQLKISQQGGDPAQAVRFVYPRMGPLGRLQAVGCCRCARQADVAAFVSNDIATRYGSKAKQSLVFHNSRVTEDMLWPRASVPVHNPFRLLYVGRLSHEKGLPFVLRALKHLDGIELRVIGTGHAKAEFKALASELNVAEKVIWVGRLQWGSELFAAMREGDACILPSLTEGLPVAFIDAISQSLPVIGSRVGGIPEVLKDGENGILISPGSSNEIVRAVNRIRSEPFWRHLHEGAFLSAHEHTIESQLGKLMAFIRDWWSENEPKQ